MKMPTPEARKQIAPTTQTIANRREMMEGSSPRGLSSQEQLRELFELREVRHRLIHSDSDDSADIDHEMVDRLKRARRNIESQIERS